MKKKNLLLSLLCLLLGAFIYSSCGDHNDDYIGFNLKNISLEADGTEKSMTITTTEGWRVTDIPEWLTVSPTTGDPGSTKVSIQATYNGEESSRSTFILFICGNSTRKIEVEQLGLTNSDSSGN